MVVTPQRVLCLIINILCSPYKLKDPARYTTREDFWLWLDLNTESVIVCVIARKNTNKTILYVFQLPGWHSHDKLLTLA